MEEAGLVISGIHICWKVGQVLIEYCKTWKRAEEEVADRVVIIECAWHRTSEQLKFMQRIDLSEDHGRMLDDLVRTLAMRLSAAITLINKSLKEESEARSSLLGFGQRVRKPTFTRLKSSIDEAIKEVEGWQARFDPSWFLIIRTTRAVIDAELRDASQKENQNAAVALNATTALQRRRPKRTQTPLQAARDMREVVVPGLARQASVFLPPMNFEIRPLPYSSAEMARPSSQRGGGGGGWYIVDPVICRPGTDLDAIARSMRALAQKMAKVDPLAFGLLSCKGVIRAPGDPARGKLPSLDMVLRVPQGLDTGESLRQFLKRQNDPDRSVSLSRYVEIARELARAVCSVHTFQFVHKNVRPESVLLLENPSDGSSATFLVGFDSFRAADGTTRLHGDVEWDRNMYRHPSRQGEFPDEKYRMHHDIYSLGVCLLELGLHETFVSYDERGTPYPGPRFRNFNAWLDATIGPGRFGGASLYLKDYFESLARQHLPRFMGTKYSQAVLTCLTCLDESNEVFGQQVDATDDTALGMHFIDEILLQIEDISL